MNNYSHLVTTALFYANGELHMGHILEAIQADIYVRHLKSNGANPLFISGSDAHGTPIMLASKKQGITPDTLVTKYWQAHKNTFEKFNIDFDNFHVTSSADNKKTTEEIFKKIKANGKIYSKVIHQAYDNKEQMFLPDRYIKGTCPKCKTPDQYGDSCESCGSFYDPLEMITPVSTLSNTTPISKESEHIFFDLPACRQEVKNFLETAELKDPVKNKLNEWLNDELKSWDISRDAPYYGFEIPGHPNKFFYVWLDAPVGYISACRNLSEDLMQIWQPENNCKIVHFIGKDIIYFHGIFWPAILKASGLKSPSQIVAHGFLKVNGAKMSKSRGTLVGADEILLKFTSDQIRYYLASKINDTVDDIDLNFEQLVSKINSDLVGKYLNIASRTAGFINKNFDGIVEFTDDGSELYSKIKQHTKQVLAYYQAIEFSKACKEIMLIADIANQAIADIAPWKLIKDSNNREQCHKFCSEIISIFRDLSILLKPIIPDIVQQSEAFLNLSNLNNNDLHSNLEQHKINPYQKIMERIPDTVVE